MKLYVCWNTFPAPAPGGHPCRNAEQALRAAGHDQEVIKVHGLGVGPRALQWVTEGREEVERPRPLCEQVLAHRRRIV